MTNLQVIKAFLNKECAHTPTREIVNGIYAYKGQMLTSNGLELINYSTVIARHISTNVVEINVKKYSVTTTKIQNKLKQLAKEYSYDVVEVIGD